jgi:hypothetical protein
MPQTVAERVVRQLTARIGKTKRHAAETGAEERQSTACVFDNAGVVIVELVDLPPTAEGTSDEYSSSLLPLARPHLADFPAGDEACRTDLDRRPSMFSVSTASVDDDGLLDFPQSAFVAPAAAWTLPAMRLPWRLACRPPNVERSAAVERDFCEAYRGIEDMLTRFRDDAANSSSPPFITRIGPCGWLILQPDAQHAGPALKCFAGALARARRDPTVHVAVGQGTGRVLGDLVGNQSCAYEFFGSAVSAAAVEGSNP